MPRNCIDPRHKYFKVVWLVLRRARFENQDKIVNLIEVSSQNDIIGVIESLNVTVHEVEQAFAVRSDC